MIKTILKIVGSFFLVLLVLIVIGLVWSSITASKKTEIAKPFFDEHISTILGWDYEKFRPLLSEGALQMFESERGQKTYRYLSKLGGLESVGEPQFINSSKGTNISTGSFDHVTFLMDGTFERGKAEILITLSEERGQLKVHYIRVNSDVFLEQ